MSDPASITLSHEEAPMSQYNPRIHGCACHGKTFCPDLICVDIEDDVPVFARRDSPEGKRTITRQAALAQPARAQAGVAELVACAQELVDHMTFNAAPPTGLIDALRAAIAQAMQEKGVRRMSDPVSVLHDVMRQVETDLASAHADIAKLQGLDPASVTWPEWSPQANTLRWFAKIRADHPRLMVDVTTLDKMARWLERIAKQFDLAQTNYGAQGDADMKGDAAMARAVAAALRARDAGGT